MSIKNFHDGKMKATLAKWNIIYVPVQPIIAPIVDPDVKVYDKAEIRAKIDSLGHLQDSLEAYLDTLPGFILRRLEQD